MISIASMGSEQFLYSIGRDINLLFFLIIIQYFNHNYIIQLLIFDKQFNKIDDFSMLKLLFNELFLLLHQIKVTSIGCTTHSLMSNDTHAQ